MLLAAFVGSCGADFAGPTGAANGGAANGGRGGESTTFGSFVSGVGGAQSCPEAGVPDVIEADDASTGCEGLEGGVSYANEVADILAGCQGEACHSSPSRTTTVGQPAWECCNERLLIAPGNATHSYLLDKIQGRDLCAGVRMPFGSPPLPASQILTIQRWICEGAPDN